MMIREGMKAIAFDTETTGINEPALVQSAWVEVDHMGEPGGAEHCRFWNPGKSIGYGAMATHHIVNADVADAPPAAAFRLPEGLTHLIGHNIDFDWKVIGEPAAPGRSRSVPGEGSARLTST